MIRDFERMSAEPDRSSAARREHEGKVRSWPHGGRGSSRFSWGRDIASMISAMKVERLYVISEKLVYDRMRVIEKTLRDYGIAARVVDFEVGSTATTYELELAAGTPIHKVAARADRISRRLGVTPVRIIAPIPRKWTVGIEVPNPVTSSSVKE